MSMMAPDPAAGGGLEALLGGGGGAPTAGPPSELEIPGGEAPQGGGDPSDMVREALDLLRAALDAEPDDEDTLVLEQMTTLGQKYLAAQQKLSDTAMGAGPGEKYVRKQGQSSGGGGGY